VQHARAVLAVAGGQRIAAIASDLHCDPSTIWRLCRRFEQSGIDQLLADQPRPGRPQQLSPPAKGEDRRTGMSGADCRGVAHDPLDQC
jgi:transposase